MWRNNRDKKSPALRTQDWRAAQTVCKDTHTNKTDDIQGNNNPMPEFKTRKNVKY
jgi:hypothetical protein